MNANDLRLFLNITDTLLTESTGLAGRKSGDVFVNEAGNKITFDRIEFVPESGAFDDQEQLLDAISAYEDEVGDQISWANTPNSGMRAFGVARFVDENDAPMYIGRYFKSINSIFTQNNFPNNLPNGYKLNTASSKKMRSGLQVQDIMTSFEDLTASDVVEQVVAKFGEDSVYSSVAYSVSKGQQLPISIPAAGVDFTSFRDYFGEILQPLVLMSGNTDNYTGDAGEAEKAFFKKNGFTTCTVTFDTGKNGGLSDSVLTNKVGKIIKISSKGAHGATASVKNLLDSIDELSITNPQLKDKYETTIDICEIIKKSGMHGSPIELGKKFDLITRTEAEQIYAFRENPETRLTPKLTKMMQHSMNKARGGDRVVPYYALLSSLAFAVEHHVNTFTSFSEEAADILNNGALVQMYSVIKLQGEKIIIDKFRTVYPSSVVSGVQFWAAKAYFATGIKGNFTFKIGGKVQVTAPAIDANAPVEFGDVDVRPKGAAKPKKNAEPSEIRGRRK